jgi:hypothetical protein
MLCAAAIFLTALAGDARAEFVFRKDGSIIEGKIIQDAKGSVIVRTLSGKNETVLRKDIIRILYTDIYIGKVYVRLTNGETVECYIVDEDQKNYTVRDDIQKPEEYQLPRSKVLFVARSNPTDVSAKADYTSISVKWAAPYVPGKKYRVYIRAPKQPEFRMVSEVSGLSKTIRELAEGIDYRIYVTAVDAKGVESLPSEQIQVTTLKKGGIKNPNRKAGDGDDPVWLSDSSNVIRARPIVTIPIGDIAKLYGIGFGSEFSFVMKNNLSKNLSLSADTGFIWWTPKKKTIDWMIMTPLFISAGYTIPMTGRMAFVPEIGVGVLFMMSQYENAVFKKDMQYGLDPAARVSLNIEYLYSDRMTLSAGGDYTLVYETKKMQMFAGAHLGAGYRL